MTWPIKGTTKERDIWGVSGNPPSWRGGFHIWPTAMGDPTSPKLAESIDVPTEAVTDPEFEKVDLAEPEPVGASAVMRHIIRRSKPRSSHSRETMRR